MNPPRPRTSGLSWALAISLLTLVSAVVGAVASTAAAAAPQRWQPSLGASYEWQLSSATIDRSVEADIYAVDGFDVTEETVAALHRDGRRVACYINTGSHENWRPDAQRFPRRLLGRPLEGWPGERWLDIRQVDELAPIMRQRMRMCQAKGFDAVEVDNVDGWQQRSGFAITPAHQLRYNRWLARTAHSMGLAIALKNDVEQVPELVDHFDYAVAEQCAQYDECGGFRPFIAAGKPVFDIEYSLQLRQFCSETRGAGVYAVRKRLALGPWRSPCVRETQAARAYKDDCPVRRWLARLALQS